MRVAVPGKSAAWMERFDDLPRSLTVTAVDLRGREISDDYLQCLAGLAELEELDLHGTAISDLQGVAGLPKLKTLRSAARASATRRSHACKAVRRCGALRWGRASLRRGMEAAWRTDPA